MSKVSQAYVTSDNPIIEIRETHPLTYIMWVIGTRCNFACSYCPDVWHDKHSSHKTLEEMKTAWRKIIKSVEHSKKQLAIGILGGEPTMNPDLLAFLQWVNIYYKSANIDISVYSNGTASLEYYQTLAKYCNFYFSTHSEFMNESKFFSIVSNLNQYNIEKNLNCRIAVLVMDEEWNKDRIPEYIKYLDEHNISWMLSPVEPVYLPESNWPEQNVKSSAGPKKSNKVNFYERITS
jgi:MoaA/NifB/PqqE/SkfB family radical SAM enzyme